MLDMAGKKKILYLITKSNWGGAQKYVFELANSMKKDYDIIVVFGGTGEKDAPSGKLKEKLEGADIRTIMIKSLSRDIHLVDEPRVFFDLLKLYKTERPDIIHLNSSKIGGLGSFAGRIYNLSKSFTRLIGGSPVTSLPAKIIFTMHGLASNEDWRPTLQKIVIKFLSWLTVLFSDKVIYINRKEFEQAKTWPFVKNRLELIYIGISPTIKNNFIKVEERPEGKPIQIGTISELTKNKGLAYAIDAISKIKDRNIMFSIIGEGEERKNLENQIKECLIEDKVKLLGFKDNAASYLGIFDTFLLSSVKEGIPYSILEAGLAGLPVIATNVGGVPEIIEDGISGILIPPKDPDAIRDALKKLLDNPDLRKTLGQNLKKTVEQKFSIDKMIEKTKKIYDLNDVREVQS